MLKENCIGRAVINHRGDNTTTTLGSHDVCALELLAADIAHHLHTFWSISVFSIDIRVYSAFVNVVQAIFGQRAYQLVENFSLDLASFRIAFSFFYALS